jgi:thioredoxin-related protein
MLVDFPRNNQLSQKIQDQNAELQHTYGTEGFPTFIVIDQNGKVLGKQIGYLQGGPKAFIAKLESMK